MTLYQVARNAVVDARTSNVAALLYYGHTVYYTDAGFAWYQWNGSGWTTIPHDPRAVEAAQGAQVTTAAGIMYDGALTSWTLVASATLGLQIAHNYIVDGNTALVSLLLYWNHTVYYQSQAGLWFYWSGGAWVSSVDPRLAPTQAPGAPTSLASPSHTGTTVMLTWAPPTTGGAIDVGGYQVLSKKSTDSTYAVSVTIPVITPGKGSISSGGHTWTITSGGLVAIDGTADTVTKGVVQGLVMPDGSFWQLVNNGNWYWEGAPGGGWQGPFTTSPLASPGVPVIGLSLDTTYNFEVRAFNSFSSGSVAGPINVRTNAAAATNFTVTNGRILDPNGNVWVSRGINVLDGLMNEFSPAQIIGRFPRCNCIRLAIGSGNGYPSGFNQPNQSWSSITNWVNAALALGLVVVIDDHEQSSGSGAYTGSALTNDLAYAKQVGSTFANATGVLIQDFNEPGFWQGIEVYHRQFYDAFRSGGSSSIVLHDVPAGFYTTFVMSSDNTPYKTQVNIGYDLHSYTNFTGGNTNQSQVNALYNNTVAGVQSWVKCSDGVTPNSVTLACWWGECGWLDYNSGDYNTDKFGGGGTNQVIYASLNANVLQGGLGSGGATWMLNCSNYGGWPNAATGMMNAGYGSLTEHGTYWNSIA